jgi:hypothetical protein
MFWGSTLVAVGIPTAACRVVHSYVQAIQKVYDFQCLRVKSSPLRWWLRMPRYDMCQLNEVSRFRHRKRSVAHVLTSIYACFCFSTWFQPG